MLVLIVTESHDVLHYRPRTFRTFDCSFLVEDVGQVALATVLPVSHAGLDIVRPSIVSEQN